MICPPPILPPSLAFAVGILYPISLAVAMICARISSLTPSLPASPLETDTILIPNRSAISAIRTAFGIILYLPNSDAAPFHYRKIGGWGQ